MIVPPSYYERIRGAAAKRWRQLEEDPELAGPWHQLFKQVQSPRHVLSELLQNADDAGATEAQVCTDDGKFTFAHNGEDFIDEQFASLCRFGYSNKRSLHTIGFRGIGFKSTFSLGDVVELYTPSLSVAFRRERFTEPQWVSHTGNGDGLTHIQVKISDGARETGLRKNLEDWLRSSLSLLFFRHIRKITIGDEEVHWKSAGPGPVPETEWMTLGGKESAEVLIARSEAEKFPDDALAEIRQERLLSGDEGAEFPPSKVEIVLGAKGQLYVVLPTGVNTDLPFACNAPFIQDSARLKIKDPEISPTNRWLLQRIGQLAARTMLHWIGDENTSVEARTSAYGLLPSGNKRNASLEEASATIVEDAFRQAISGQPILLTNSGELKPAKQSVIIPQELFEVWPREQAATLFDSMKRPPLTQYVSSTNCQKLIRWDLVEQIDKNRFVDVLQSTHLPKPKSWRSLLKLWVYIAPEINTRFIPAYKRAFRILPAQGKDVLYSASEVVRLGEKKLLQSEEDWEFLSKYLLVVNQNWLRFLAEQRRAAEQEKDEALGKELAIASNVFHAIDLDNASDVSQIIEQVARSYFGQQSCTVNDCVRLAQIACTLGASVGGGSFFQFVTKDNYRRTGNIIWDADGTLADLVPEDWGSSHLLHSDYRHSQSCTEAEWLTWIIQGRAGLLGFVPLSGKTNLFWNRSGLESELRNRGFTGAIQYPYQRDSFQVEDWEFEEVIWQHWNKMAECDSYLWGRVVERILAQPENYWKRAQSAKAFQVSSGYKRSIVNGFIPAKWVLQLRELPCLPDTRGFYHKPHELLLRTPETEPFMDAEPFVHGRLDREATRELLKLLGVRDAPIGPDLILDRLRALSKAEKPPVQEVEKWYGRLDQVVVNCSTADFIKIRKAFQDERIILTQSGIWASASGIYLSSDEEDVPGAEVVRPSVRDLTLWRKVEIADRPSVELAIQWLKILPSGEVLPPNDIRRVRALLPRHAARIWEECGHWLNLTREWAPISTIEYCLTMQTLIPWEHLHGWVKKKTADLQNCAVDVTEILPFSRIPRLAGQIENRFDRSPIPCTSPEWRPWLNELGAGLQRIELADETETKRIRELAGDLAKTVWQTAPGLEMIPYIDGVPAGTPRRTEVIWRNNVLFAEDRGPAKLARAVSQELGRFFGKSDIIDAIKLCFDRSPEFVAEYLEENFELVPMQAILQENSNNADCNKPVNASQEPERESPNTNEDTQGLHNGPLPAPASDGGAQDEAEHKDLRDDHDEIDNHEEHTRGGGHAKTPPKPSIIERFAREQGFEKDGDNRFYHSDGSWIGKSDDARFWDRWAGNGELVGHYWPKDHCLERQPLQMESDLWGMIEKFPEQYVLVLSNEQDEPVALKGTSLLAMRKSGQLTLHPATYRLVYGDEA